MHYDNPYKDAPGFVDLGEYNLNTYDGTQEQYDLYAIVRSKTEISFGAKHGPSDDEYLTGVAIYSDKRERWSILTSGAAVSLAAARYFANVHRSKKK